MHPPGKKTIAQLEESIQKAETNPISQAMRFDGNKGIFGKEGFQPKPPRLVLGQEKSGMKQQTLIWL